MSDVKTGPNPLFLREEELRLGMDLLEASYRAFTEDDDGDQPPYPLGPAQLRLLSLVRAHPGIGVSDALASLDITKQSLSRLLAPLIDDGLVLTRPGLRDRRQRVLELTDKGYDIERQSTGARLRRIARAYREAGADAVEGFRKVLLNMLDKTERDRFRRAGARPRHPVGPGR